MSNQISDILEIEHTDNPVHAQYYNSLESFSQRLEVIKNSLKEVPELNEARIVHFKSQINLGHYAIDDDMLARKMLSMVAPK